MKRAITIALALLLMVVAEASAAEDLPADDPGWLFVVHGQVISVTDGAIMMAAGTYGTAFTDRPERLVRLFDIEAFVSDAWSEKGDFRLLPPNASLVDLTGNSIAIVEVMNASLDAGALSLAVVILDGALPVAGDVIALTIDVKKGPQGVDLDTNGQEF